MLSTGSIEKKRKKTKGMAGIPDLPYETYWKNESEANRVAYKEVIVHHPQAKAEVEKLYDIITDITGLAGCTPKEISESKEWANIVKRAEAGRASLCATLEGETFFSALYGVYMLAFIDLKSVLKTKYGKEGYHDGQRQNNNPQTRRRLQGAKM